MINIYVDIDGVLNSLSKGAPRQNTMWEGEWMREKIMGYWIHWSTELVKTINDLSLREDVTCKWLTTWQESAITEFAPIVNIGHDWPFFTGETDNDHHNWWKFPVIQKDVEETQPDKFVWIDDDMSYVQEAWNWINDHPKGLGICPISVHGLTRKHLDTIVEFIDN